MSKQLDLLEWAMSQPTAQVIDATEQFDRRAINFAVDFVQGRVRTFAGCVVSLDTARRERKAEPAGLIPPPARANGPAA